MAQIWPPGRSFPMSGLPGGLRWNCVYLDGQSQQHDSISEILIKSCDTDYLIRYEHLSITMKTSW